MSAVVRHQLWILTAACAVFFTNLGGALLWDEDETIYATVVNEMLARGDWVVPTFNGQLATDKPPLLYWVMMTASTLLGPTEFAARVGSALAALLTVWLLYDLGRRLYRPEVGLWGALALTTGLLYDISARAATTDALLVLFCTGSLWIYMRAGGVAGRPLGWRTFAALYAVMGLGNLTKGPVGFVCPTFALVLFELLRPGRLPALMSAVSSSRFVGSLRWLATVFAPRRVWQAGWSLRPLLAIATIAVVSLPWFVLVGLRTDGEWLTGFFGEHNFQRLLEPNYNHRGPIYYHVVGSLIGLFPWSVFLPLAAYQLVRRIVRGERDAAADTFIACWAVAYMLPFSIASTKLPNYVLPAYPALAIVVGAFVANWLRDTTSVRAIWLRMAFSATAIAGAGIVIGLGVMAHFVLKGNEWIALVGLVPLIGGVAAQWLYVRGRAQGAAITFAIMTVLLAIVGFGYSALGVSTYHSGAWIAIDWRTQFSPDAPLASYRHQAPSEIYYAGRSIYNFWDPTDVSEFFAESPDACLLTWAHEYQSIADALPADVRVLDRRPRFLRRGEVLLLGRPRSTTQHTARNESISR